MEENNSHVALDAALRSLLLEGVPSRPFVCSGSPFNCDVAIVGINPATTTSFWKHWSIKDGFNRTAWIAEYNADPVNRRRQTRPRIERLVQSLASIRIVEFNAYPYATASEQELTSKLRDTRVLELLLQVARPRLVFVFGKSPSIEFSKLLEIPLLERGMFTPCNFANHSFTVLYESHLSRGWSYERIEQLAQKISTHLSSAEGRSKSASQVLENNTSTPTPSEFGSKGPGSD